MNQYSWYHYISGIYDYFTVLPYQKIRSEAISKLKITPGDMVIDLGCGTGLNLETLSRYVGENGTVIAVEPSKGMLNQAKKKAKNFDLKNVVFIEQGIAEFTCSNDFSKCLVPNLKVISILVISVIPDWEETLKDLIQALPNGSQILIMDLFSKKTLVSFFINKLAQSDISRKSWPTLEAASSDFMIWWYKTPCYFGVKAFIATGYKNSNQNIKSGFRSALSPHASR